MVASSASTAALRCEIQMRESDIEKYLVARIKALGGECRKVQWVGRRGAPDRLVMLPADQPLTTAWIELKRPGEVAEPHQAREHERMGKMGQIVLVIDSIALVDLHFPLN